MKRGTIYLSIISILEAYKNLGIQNDHESLYIKNFGIDLHIFLHILLQKIYICGTIKHTALDPITKDIV